jgi:carnitine O-acetyltransferase
VSVYGEQGEPLNQSQLLAQLQDVISKSTHPSSSPVGILTSENRNTWGKVHKALKKGCHIKLSSYVYLFFHLSNLFCVLFVWVIV